MADAVCAALAQGGTVQHMSEQVWDALWSQERRQQVGGRGRGERVGGCF